MTHSGRGIILMAVYRPNTALFARQVASIKAQTHSAWECVIGIDGEDAATRSVAETLIAKDPRFTVIEFTERRGFYRNFERLASMASKGYDWVAFADQDDYWRPEKLQRLSSVLEGSPDMMAVSGQARIVDTAGRTLGRTDRRPGRLADMIFDNALTGSFMLVRPLVLEVAIPFPCPRDVAFHDHWIGVCASALGGVRAVPEVLQDYVQHGGNVIGEARMDSTAVRWRRVEGLGVSGRLTYLARERWGWRVAMARSVLRRQAELAPAVVSDLGAVSRGTVSPRLLMLLLSGVIRRAVPPGRALSLLVGSVWWRKVEPRMEGGSAGG